MRLWTLDEAKAFLPQARRLLETVQTAADATAEARAGLDALAADHGELVADVEHPDHPAYASHVAALEASTEAFTAGLEVLHAAGVDVKGVRPGLMDFPAEVAGRTVYLCWSEGEATITHWHEVEGGFAGRRPIPDLLS